jgi:uncharacterized membrane protein
MDHFTLPKIFQLHPLVVHFPIVLLVVGLFGLIWLRLFKRPEWLEPAVSWCLWLGAAFSWISVVLGLVAEDQAPHVPKAWDVLADHKLLGLSTAVFFTFLSIWRLLSPKAKPWLFLIFWLAGYGLLFDTAYHGGMLVYDFGMGVLKR